MVALPRAVRWRWQATSFTQARSRFWRAGTRPDSNAFSRWWWIAEQTRHGADYSLTVRLFANSSLTTQLFIRELAWVPAFVSASITVLEGDDGQLVERTMKKAQRALGTVAAEAMSHDELVDLMKSLKTQQADITP